MSAYVMGEVRSMNPNRYASVAMDLDLAWGVVNSDFNSPNVDVFFSMGFNAINSWIIPAGNLK